MENASRLHPQSGHAPLVALETLRRLSREVFLDLGLTEDEIAAYFGGDPKDIGGSANGSAGKGAGKIS